MKSGYKIYWTDSALEELENTYHYLEVNWTEREIKSLSMEIERVLHLISDNPKIFPPSDTANVRKVNVKKFNTLYYRQVDDETVEILSFFSNKQNPDKRKLY